MLCDAVCLSQALVESLEEDAETEVQSPMLLPHSLNPICSMPSSNGLLYNVHSTPCLLKNVQTMRCS